MTLRRYSCREKSFAETHKTLAISMSNNHRLNSVSGNQVLEADLASHGFQVLKSFLEPSELPIVRSLVGSVLTSSRDISCTRPHNTLVPLRWNDAIVRLLLASERRVQAIAEVSRAQDLKWISGYVSIKEPGSPALWWHQDWWCWDHPVSYHRAPPQISVLCYLTDTNANNGALRVLPASHLKSAPIHAFLPEAHSHHAGDLEPEHISMTDLPNQATPPLNAGDAVVIDYRLLHGTHPNGSSTSRKCILLSFTPSWCGLPEDIKAHLIAHPAQPSDRERLQPTPMLEGLIPIFVGRRQDLPINRNAPSVFDILERGSNRPPLR